MSIVNTSRCLKEMNLPILPTLPTDRQTDYRVLFLSS